MHACVCTPPHTHTHTHKKVPVYSMAWTDNLSMLPMQAGFKKKKKIKKEVLNSCTFTIFSYDQSQEINNPTFYQNFFIMTCKNLLLWWNPEPVTS